MSRSSPPLAHRPASVRGTRRRGQGVENSSDASSSAASSYVPKATIISVQYVGIRAWRAGEENPRLLYERSAASRPTHALRPARQLRDEVKSGGNQHTYIRAIHRRQSCPPRPGVIGRFVPRITVRRPPHSARLSGGLLRERLVTSPTVRDLVFHRLWRHCARRVTAPRRVCANADVTGGQQRTGEHRMVRHGLGNHFLHRRNSSRSTSRPIEPQGGSAV